MQSITSMRECLLEKHANPADTFDQAAWIQLCGWFDSSNARQLRLSEKVKF